jgi:hypothetical protein
MGMRIRFLAVAMAGALCFLAEVGPTPVAQAGDQGMVVAQWQQPGMQQQGGQRPQGQQGQQGGQRQGQPQQGQPQQQGMPQQQGGPANNSCVQSYQRCVMMCAGVGNCVNNCNIGYAVCQQQQGGGS